MRRLAGAAGLAGATPVAAWLRRVRRSGGWYVVAVAAVAAATFLTRAFPLLRDRLTFFAFWPVIFTVSWLGGVGPGLVSSVLSAVAVLAFLPMRGFPGAGLAIGTTVGVFVVAGACAGFLARWRQRTEAELRESRDRFRMLASSAPVLIWMADASGRCTFVNDAWLAFTGATLEQALAAGWSACIHPDDRARCEQSWRAALAARQPFSLEYRRARSDGSERFVFDRGQPRFADSGTFLGMIGSCADITEQRSALERAERALVQAEQANQAKDAFLAVVSHELRTPLAPIIAWARMLESGRLDGAQTARALAVIVRSARTQAQLVEDLLDVSRIVEGKLRLSVRPVDLATIVQSAVETMRAAADAKGLRLQVALDAPSVPVLADPDRLQQVVWNLISNAVKFTPQGGHVDVTLRRGDAQVEIAVQDTGRGIAADVMPHLFERFWQADVSSSRAQGGLGLGLAIVRHLVEMHGGTVVAASPGEGRGATFTVKLPAAALEAKAGEELRRPALLAEDAPPAPPTRLDVVRVLVVDDEPDASESLSLLLAALGAEVRVAASVSEAMAVLAGWLPDVIVSDVGMPGEDGYALIARVRARSDAVARVPAIALTAYASVEDRVRLLSAGFQMHVGKPADPAEIAAAIASVCRAR